MSIFMQLTNERDIVSEAFNPVTEGWGTYMMKGGLVNMVVSQQNLQNLFRNKDLVNYIEKECKRILSECRKKDKSVTNKLPSGFLNDLKKWWHNNDEEGFFSWTNFAHYKDTSSDYLAVKIPDFYISVFFDTDHIQSVVVVLYSEQGDRFFGKKLNPPAKENGTGFRRESI